MVRDSQLEDEMRTMKKKDSSYELMKQFLLQSPAEVNSTLAQLKGLVQEGNLLTIGTVIDALEIEGFQSNKLNPGMGGLPNFASFGLIQSEIVFGSVSNATVGKNSKPYNTLLSLNIGIIATDAWTITRQLIVPFFGFSLGIQTSATGSRMFSGSISASVMLSSLYTLGIFVPFNIPGRVLE